MGWFLDSHCFHDRWSNVNIGNHLFNYSTTLKQVGALHQHWHPNRCLVGNTLVNKTMLPKHEPVVTHIDNERLITNAHFVELLKHCSDTVINRTERFAVPLVIRFNVELTVIRKVDTMPAISLIKKPSWKIPIIANNFVFTVWSIKLFFTKTTLVTIFWREVRMHCLVRKVEKEWFIGFSLLLKKINCIVRQQCRDVPILRHSLSIDVDCVVRVWWKIVPLAFKAHPVIKPRAWIIMMTTHMPLADKACRVAGFL